MHVQKDYEELLELFNKHGVKYCVVGAFAVGFYSVPRYTKDIDIVVEASAENADRVMKALDDFGFGNIGLTKDDLLKSGQIIQLGNEPVRIDILTSIDGVTFERMWRNKKVGDFGKQKANFIGFDELVLNKKKSGRGRDIVDLDTLKKIRAVKKSKL